MSTVFEDLECEKVNIDAVLERQHATLKFLKIMLWNFGLLCVIASE